MEKGDWVIFVKMGFGIFRIYVLVEEVEGKLMRVEREGLMFV